MGYRSSVYFQVPVSEWCNFRRALQDESECASNAPMSEIEKFLEDLRQTQFPDRYIFFHDYIKWYEEGDPVIGCVKRALDNLTAYLFYRVGEDSEDSEFWDSCSDNSEWIRGSSLSCVGTEDALSNALTFLGGIEKASHNVRQKAIEQLDAVLNRLIVAEDGVGSLQDTSDFKEDE